MDRQHPDRYEKYEMVADMTENRQYWESMVKTGPQRWETVSKCKNSGRTRRGRTGSLKPGNGGLGALNGAAIEYSIVFSMNSS